AFHPRHISIVQALPVVLCRSINVLEETADGFIVRELKLEPVKGE
ncbi:radical SAM protein, partial [Bacteroides xylanisolvens]|nr:radical SAM protein [Bacteroides xylanisolvens]